VPGATSTSATSISVLETLELLDNEFASLAHAVAEGRYTFWLGSGISRSRVDGLREVIPRVLEFLRSRIDPIDPNCLYKKAMEEALGFANLSTEEQKEVRLDRATHTWPILEMVVLRLTGEYSNLLNVRIHGQPADYLVWEAVDVVSSFASIGVDPDCEHYCIAVLALEGLLPNIVSANWDGLIERALEDLTTNDQVIMSIRVRPDDLREPNLRSQLIKIHGCAVRARHDETEYRRYLVGSKTQILTWPHDEDHRVMRQALVLLATTTPTLMIGLSGQDTNIQDIFAEAKEAMAWPWPGERPALVFAEDAIQQYQRTILQITYGTSYESHAPDIEASAHVRAFAKPLLVALVLHNLATKMAAFAVQAHAPNVSTATDAAEIAKGLVNLRDAVAAHTDGDRYLFIIGFLGSLSRAMAQFQEGHVSPGSVPYRAVSGNPVHEIPSEPGLSTGGMPQLAMALGLLGLGLGDGSWDLTHNSGTGDPRDCPIEAVSASGTARVFFAANQSAAMQLELSGGFDPTDDDVIVIHSMNPLPAMPRSPVATVGRTGHGGPRDVDMRDLLTSADDLADLRRQFREAASL
jgi:hypothetical protein